MTKSNEGDRCWNSESPKRFEGDTSSSIVLQIVQDLVSGRQSDAQVLVNFDLMIGSLSHAMRVAAPYLDDEQSADLDELLNGLNDLYEIANRRSIQPCNGRRL